MKFWVRIVAVGMLMAAAGCAARNGQPHPEVNGGLAGVPNASGETARSLIPAKAIILVRHADNSPDKAAGLTAAGAERADELAAVLRDAGVNKIVVSPWRTLETASPLAASMHIEPVKVQVDHEGDVRRYKAIANVQERAALKAKLEASEAAAVKAQVAAVTNPGDVVLVVYHHSVIPAILEQFGVHAEARINEEKEFDRMYVIIPIEATGEYRVLRLRYGKMVSGVK